MKIWLCDNKYIGMKSLIISSVLASSLIFFSRPGDSSGHTDYAVPEYQCFDDLAGENIANCNFLLQEKNCQSIISHHKLYLSIKNNEASYLRKCLECEIYINGARYDIYKILNLFSNKNWPSLRFKENRAASCLMGVEYLNDFRKFSANNRNHPLYEDRKKHSCCCLLVI